MREQKTPEDGPSTSRVETGWAPGTVLISVCNPQPVHGAVWIGRDLGGEEPRARSGCLSERGIKIDQKLVAKTVRLSACPERHICCS